MGNIKPFLRLQTDAWLLTLKDRVADAILNNSVTIAFSNSSQSGTKQVVMPPAELSAQLTDVLIEKSLVSGTATTKQTFARFSR
jgi:hypothetical protein